MTDQIIFAICLLAWLGAYGYKDMVLAAYKHLFFAESPSKPHHQKVGSSLIIIIGNDKADEVSRSLRSVADSTARDYHTLIVIPYGSSFRGDENTITAARGRLVHQKRPIPVEQSIRNQLRKYPKNTHVVLLPAGITLAPRSLASLRKTYSEHGLINVLRTSPLLESSTKSIIAAFESVRQDWQLSAKLGNDINLCGRAISSSKAMLAKAIKTPKFVSRSWAPTQSSLVGYSFVVRPSWALMVSWLLLVGYSTWFAIVEHYPILLGLVFLSASSLALATLATNLFLPKRLKLPMLFFVPIWGLLLVHSAAVRIYDYSLLRIAATIRLIKNIPIATRPTKTGPSHSA